MPASRLEGNYPLTLACALAALVPYILVASGAALYEPQVTADIGVPTGSISIIDALSTALYAFGALLAGDLINRLPQRPLFFACEAIFVIGWLVAACAFGTWSYGAGRLAAGLATGMLLVTALPPAIRRFPPSRLPLTAAFVNLGLFGAIAAGPLVGGIAAAGHDWRLLYAIFAALGVLTVAVAWPVLPEIPPSNPDLAVDRSGLALGFAATVLPFFASGALRAYGFASPIVILPFLAGLGCLVALLLVEYHKEEPLAPVRKMWTTMPVIGVIVAMVGGGAFVTFMQITAQVLLHAAGQPPLGAGLAFWPQVVGVLIAASLLGLLFRTRFLPVLALFGMLVLMGGGALLAIQPAKPPVFPLSIAIGLMGIGAGATVSPGLFIAGFALPSKILGRIFALVELVRSNADFILSPVMLSLAKASSGTPDMGRIHLAIWITVAISAAGTLGCVLLFALGGRGLVKPDLVGWLKRDQVAVDSPALAQAVSKKA